MALEAVGSTPITHPTNQLQVARFGVFYSKGTKFNIGVSSSGKTQHFDCCIRRFESCHPSQKETTIFDRRLSFLFGLFTFLFSFFSLLSNCRFQRKGSFASQHEGCGFIRILLFLRSGFIGMYSFCKPHQCKKHSTPDNTACRINCYIL